jgi:hypothetical protein
MTGLGAGGERGERGAAGDPPKRGVMGRAIVGALAAAAMPAAAGGQAGCPRPRLPAYAHNDYANARPLTDALALGFRGVEADLFLVDGVLRVGHDRRSARTGASFEAAYLAPLQAVLARCGRLGSDGLPFLLAVEFKATSPAAYDSLGSLLARYPAVTAAAEVVLVGWHPTIAVGSVPPVLLARQHRLRSPGAVDAAALDDGVRLLSVDYGKTLGRWWVREAGRRRWLAGLRAVKAAQPARRLRVHNVPVDAAVYRALLAAGVDLIGTKDLPATARLLARVPAP